jgi:hypothetical protein
MAIMSFAHLKKKPLQGQPVQSAVVQVAVQDVIQGEKAEKTDQDTSVSIAPIILARTTYRIPAVSLTALLVKVNYCRGCGRFLPADQSETDHRNPYGKCLRETDENGMQVWKIIPATAQMTRCFYMLENQQSEN